jgi:hypothetical protein
VQPGRELQRVEHERLSRHADQRLGNVLGQRAQSAAEARGQQDDLHGTYPAAAARDAGKRSRSSAKRPITGCPGKRRVKRSLAKVPARPTKGIFAR